MPFKDPGRHRDLARKWAAANRKRLKVEALKLSHPISQAESRERRGHGIPALWAAIKRQVADAGARFGWVLHQLDAQDALIAAQDSRVTELLRLVGMLADQQAATEAKLSMAARYLAQDSPDMSIEDVLEELHR